MKRFTLSFALLVGALFAFATPSQAQASDFGFSIHSGSGRGGVSFHIGSGHSHQGSRYYQGQRHYRGRPGNYGGSYWHRNNDYRYRNHDYRRYQYNPPQYRVVYVRVPVYGYRQVWDPYRRTYVNRYVVVGYRLAKQYVPYR